jgi:hypothetical protein
MEMIRAYQGHFEQGRFISLENVVIPENKRVFVMVVDDELPPVKTIAEQQHDALIEFFAGIGAIKGESLDVSGLKRVSFKNEPAL